MWIETQPTKADLWREEQFRDSQLIFEDLDIKREVREYETW